MPDMKCSACRMPLTGGDDAKCSQCDADMNCGPDTCKCGQCGNTVKVKDVKCKGCLGLV